MSFFEGQFINDGATHPIPDHLSQHNQEATPANIALFKASKAGSMVSVKKALANGAKPNFFFNPEDSKNSLHIAAEEGHVEVSVLIPQSSPLVTLLPIYPTSFYPIIDRSSTNCLLTELSQTA